MTEQRCLAAILVADCHGEVFTSSWMIEAMLEPRQS
jgi:hypothetical protein